MFLFYTKMFRCLPVAAQLIRYNSQLGGGIITCSFWWHHFNKAVVIALCIYQGMVIVLYLLDIYSPGAGLTAMCKTYDLSTVTTIGSVVKLTYLVAGSVV